jgi:AcrR family transcriptional regulator
VSPRPRTKSNEAVLAAAWRVIQRVGPAKFTLARVAREVRLSPATLVQRFGSKRKLLLLLIGGSRGSTEQWVADARTRITSPLELLYAFFDCFAGMATSPKEMANHLAFLQIDITDPAFHQLALEQARANERAVRELLDEAVAARELARMPTSRIARLLMNVSGGSLLHWAILQEGNASDWLRSDIEAALLAYRPERR